MPRRARRPSETGYYHILTRGNNRQAIFYQDADHQFYLEVLGQYRRRFSWRLHHFCLMPNHVHLLLHIAEFKILGKLMQGINQTYEKHCRLRYQHSGHLWQGRYKSIPIEKEDYLLECSRYIERNPVRAGLVDTAEEYPWSSYLFYSAGKSNPLVEPDPVYLRLGATFLERSKAYREYLEATRPYEQLLDKSLKIGDVPKGDTLHLAGDAQEKG